MHYVSIVDHKEIPQTVPVTSAWINMSVKVHVPDEKLPILRLGVYFTKLTEIILFYQIDFLTVQFWFFSCFFSSKWKPSFYVLLPVWLKTRHLNKNKGLPVLPAGDENPAGEMRVQKAVNPAFMLFMVLWKKRLKTTFGSFSRLPLFCWCCRNAVKD